MRIMQGERPSRPLPGDKCSLEPSDDAWDLISQCWAHESDARPEMAEVYSLLVGTVAVPSSGGSSQSASEIVITKHVGRQSCVHYHSSLVFKASNWAVRRVLLFDEESMLKRVNRIWTSSTRIGRSFMPANWFVSRKLSRSGTNGASCSFCSSTTTVRAYILAVPFPDNSPFQWC
jgi:hypothetical protein